jgi:rhamnosyltransferase
MTNLSSRLFPQKISDVCAVITAYCPDDYFPERVSRIRAQVGLVVIVVDGGGRPNIANILKNLFQNDSSIIVSPLSENMGIATALNVGISIAKQRKYKWVLTLDDDTIVESDMMKNLVESWHIVTKQGGKPIALMGMLSKDAYTGNVDDNHGCKNKSFVEKRGIITSGSLMSLDAYDVIGPFREEFFIDSVDYDYCMRARANGYSVIKICKIGMTHSLGRAKDYNIGWLKIQTTNHNTVRRYYMYRNSTVLAREYFLCDPLYSLAVFLFQLKTLFIVLFLEKDRIMKLKSILQGVLDGWKKRMGKIISNP